MGKKEKNVEIQRMLTGDLPEGWVISTLGEISTKPQYGWTTKANHESGKVKLLRTTDITSGKIDWTTVPYCTKEPDDLDKYLLELGDIVISRAGSVGVSYLLTDTDNAVFASYLIRFRPIEPVDKKYVYYYLKSPDYWKAIGKSTLGIAVPNVNATKLAKVKIPIAPENEQKRIVAEIEKQFSRLDEAVDNLKCVKANLKRYKASVLKAAVEGRLTEKWRKKHLDVEPANILLERILAERRKKWEKAELGKMKAKGKEPKDDKWKKKYKEPTKPDVDDLPALPDGWVWVTYEQVGEWTGGGTPSKRKPEYWEKGTIPWVSPKDMKIDKINKTIDKITVKAVKESVAKLIPSNSLLFVVRSGILRRILPIALTEVDVTVNQDLKALTPSAFPNANYLLISAQAFSDDILHTCQKDGTTVESIEVPALQIYPIPLPPLSEQEIIAQEISRKLTVVDEIENEIESNFIRADRLSQSILKKAFTGKLVPQDHNVVQTANPLKQSA